MKAKHFSSYALLGSGRLARHLRFYLSCLNLPFVNWSRNADPAFNSFTELDTELRLRKTLSQASHVLVATKDQAINELVQKCLPGQTIVHFSGALQINSAFSAHPLMTFGDRIESLEWYKSIPFIIDVGQDFADLLPGLVNPHYALAPHLRPLYHSLCSLAGNSTFLLWQRIGDEFEQSLNLPRELLSPFLHQVVTNSRVNHPSALTGPLARGDWQVVRTHLEALAKVSDLHKAYNAYLELAAHFGLKPPEGSL